MKVVWSETAKQSLTNIYDYIHKDSPHNAEKVLETFLELGDSLSNKHLEYAKDPIINNEKIRFVTRWSYKIIYERKADTVVILDVFHAKQNPDKLVFER